MPPCHAAFLLSLCFCFISPPCFCFGPPRRDESGWPEGPQGFRVAAAAEPTAPGVSISACRGRYGVLLLLLFLPGRVLLVLCLSLVLSPFSRPGVFLFLVVLLVLSRLRGDNVVLVASFRFGRRMFSMIVSIVLLLLLCLVLCSFLYRRVGMYIPLLFLGLLSLRRVLCLLVLFHMCILPCRRCCVVLRVWFGRVLVPTHFR